MDKLNLPQVMVTSRGLIFFEEKFLFLRRAAEDKYNPNKWELPGGKLDEGETLEENLVRESMEETGLDSSIIITDICVADEKVYEGKYAGYTVITIFGILKALTASPKLSSEHSEYLWLDLKNASKLDLTPVTKIFMDKLQSRPYLIALLNDVKTLSLPNK